MTPLKRGIQPSRGSDNKTWANHAFRKTTTLKWYLTLSYCSQSATRSRPWSDNCLPCQQRQDEERHLWCRCLERGHRHIWVPGAVHTCVSQMELCLNRYVNVRTLCTVSTQPVFLIIIWSGAGWSKVQSSLNTTSDADVNHVTFSPAKRSCQRLSHKLRIFEVWSFGQTCWQLISNLSVLNVTVLLAWLENANFQTETQTLTLIV